MDNRIHLKSIGHYFDDGVERVSLFNDLTLDIHQGKSYAIVGPSGAGKSSLLSIAARLESPKSGTVESYLSGRAVTANQLRKQSGFIFQHFYLLPELDALHNLALPLRLKGEKNAEKKALHWLTRVGLEHRARHRPAQLSGGEQQRIAIARAFIASPTFIFADEPTGNLDEKTAGGISELLFEFANSENKALVIVTHSPQLAAKASRQLQLAAGRLEYLT